MNQFNGNQLQKNNPKTSLKIISLSLIFIILEMILVFILGAKKYISDGVGTRNIHLDKFFILIILILFFAIITFIGLKKMKKWGLFLLSSLFIFNIYLLTYVNFYERCFSLSCIWEIKAPPIERAIPGGFCFFSTSPCFFIIAVVLIQFLLSIYFWSKYKKFN